MISPDVFREWNAKYEELKTQNPPDGTLIYNEHPTEPIKFEYKAEEQFLSAWCVLSTRILKEGTNEMDPPHWVLVPESGDTTFALRVVIAQPSKRIYLGNQGKLPIKGIKILRASRSGKSVLGELVI